MQLLDEGDLRPTAPRVAARAGVSVRSVFQHFADLETLHASVAERLVERVAVLVVPIDPALGLEERIERFTRQRGMLLEAITPIRRAADVHGPFSGEIRSRLSEGQRFLLGEVAAAFEPELAEAGEGRGEVLLALDAALSWATWHSLRNSHGCDVPTAEAVVRRLVGAILACA